MTRLAFSLPTDFTQAHELMSAHATFLKRTQCEETFFRAPDGFEARLHRQDTVSRLAWSDRPDGETCLETVVLDHRACRVFLERIGMIPLLPRRFLRETWKKHCYVFHLDRLESGQDQLTVECETDPSAPAAKTRRQALKCLKTMGIIPLKTLVPPRIDSLPSPDYTAPVKPKAFPA